MKKTNPYAAKLTKLSLGQTATFNRTERNEVAAEVKRLNTERNPYHYKQSLRPSGLEVTRVVPENYNHRQLYIETISASQLSSTLKKNGWNKEAAANIFGISARSIGRMMLKHGIKAAAPGRQKAQTARGSRSASKRG